MEVPFQSLNSGVSVAWEEVEVFGQCASVFGGHLSYSFKGTIFKASHDLWG